MYRPPSFPTVVPSSKDESNTNEGRATMPQLHPYSRGFPPQQPMRPMMGELTPPRFLGGPPHVGTPPPFAPRMSTPAAPAPAVHQSNGLSPPPPIAAPRPLQNQSLAPPPPPQFRPPTPPQAAAYQQNQSTGQYPMQAPYPGQSMQRTGSLTGQSSSPRIDPSQIPRPTEKESDPVVHFETRSNGSHQVPPAASARYIGKEVGNCDPKFLRLSLNYVPVTSELCNNVALPLVAFIQPLALQKPEESSIKVVDFGESGPVRCGRCGAYMNPFMSFQDGGRSFFCPFCNAKNETPANYFCYLGPDGQRRDTYDRPELHLGTFEIAAPSNFMVRPPMPPVHFFLIESTFAAVSTGALHAICSSIKLILNSIQGQERALVGIATMDSVIQFYHVKNEEGGPQILIVSDITEVFSPLPSLLMSLKDQKESIIEILDLIPKLYQEQKSGESCAGAAIEAAIEALKPVGGKLHVMLSTRPSLGSRHLKPREPQISPSAEKAEKEKQTVLLPQDNTYRTLALIASEHYICIDLFFFAHSYLDISTLSVLSTTTGGSVYKYEKFTVQKSAQQFMNDLRWNVSRPQGFEAVLRVRCSTGLEIESYLGSMNVRNQHEIELPGIDCDKSIMVKFLHDDKLQEGDQAYFQCALLYTTTSGHRRIRVSTLAVPVTSEVTRIFRGADLESNLNYLARKSAAMLPGSTLHAGKELVINGCANVLAAYRKYVSTTSASGQLILPDSLKLMPLYGLALMKSVALSLDSKPDERAAFLAMLMSLPCSKILRLVYGRFFELDGALTQEEITIPESLWLSSEKLMEGKVFLYENGSHLFIKVDHQVPKETMKALFGVEELPSSDEPNLVHSEHPLNIKLHKFLNELRMREGCYMSTNVAVKSKYQDSRFLNALIEDRNINGPSYVQFLCTLHRMIQQKLS
eukprot:g7021.t1